MTPEVIVHHLAQAKAALRVAEAVGLDIQLRSAPGTAAYAGVGYLHALSEAAGQTLIVDCDDDAGLVMAALHAGCRRLIFSGSVDTWRRLNNMAVDLNADIRDPLDQLPPCLTLSPDDDDRAIRTWLTSIVEI